MRRAWKYRLYPNKKQGQALTTMLDTHRHLYNRALAQRKDAWEQDQRSVSYQEQGDGCKLKEGRLYIQHIGLLKVKWHREMAGAIKTVSLKREADGWYVIFSCEVPDVILPIPEDGPACGIDLGLKAFLMTSDGEEVKPPKFYRKAQKALRRAQRKFARRKKGSARRGKAARLLKKQHQHIGNQRRNFHYQTAHSLVRRYGLIVHEDLNVAGIARSRLAKSTYDIGWSGFLAILNSKAEEAGVQVIAVPPHNTTQRCSACGRLPEVKKTLADRVHVCPFCGYTADRDVNAAQNILWLGRSRQAGSTPLGMLA